MTIGKLFRKNAPLAIGILLPVAVVVFFLLARSIPALLVDPPQYDFLFVEDYGYSDRQSPWRFQIDVSSDRRLRVQALPTEPKIYVARARLFLYQHASDEVREIPLPLPETDGDTPGGVAIEIPEFADQVIDTKRVAPDGYEVVKPRRGSGPFGLFRRAPGYGLAISKSGRVVSVPPDQERNYNGPRFLGWVVTSPDKSP